MDSHWLKNQFKNHPYKSKADLAKALGLEPPAISKILANTRQIKAKEYAIMRRFFGLPVDETQMSARHTASNDGHALNPGLAETNQPDGRVNWDIPDHVIQKRVSLAPEKIRIYKVAENVMEPHFKQGEYIAIDTSDHKVQKSGVFMISDGYSMLLRHCEIPANKTEEIHISAYQLDFQTHIIPVDDIQIIGRVIAKMQWV